MDQEKTASQLLPIPDAPSISSNQETAPAITSCQVSDHDGDEPDDEADDDGMAILEMISNVFEQASSGQR